MARIGELCKAIDQLPRLRIFQSIEKNLTQEILGLANLLESIDFTLKEFLNSLFLKM